MTEKLVHFDEAKPEKRHNIPKVNAIIAQFSIIAEKNQVVKRAKRKKWNNFYRVIFSATDYLAKYSEKVTFAAS